MSTNYYVKSDKCKCCGHKPEQLHIGKKSHGWSFSFHATDELMTWQDWKMLLVTQTIVDNYGDEISFKDFKELVTESRGARNHTTYCQEHHPTYVKENLFLDPEGYSFTRGEFS